MKDPKLTAYALGEETPKDSLSAEEKERVAELRDLGNLISHEMQKEKCPELNPKQREKIEKTFRQKHTAKKKPNWLRNLAWSSGISALAASLLVFIVYFYGPQTTLNQAKLEGTVIPASEPVKQKEEATRQYDTRSVERKQPLPRDKQNLAPMPPPTAGARVRMDALGKSKALGDETYEHSSAIALREARPMEGSAIVARGGMDDKDRVVGEKVAAQQFMTEAYDRVYENNFLAVEQNPLSTFSIDVDTASYANVRRYLQAGRLPPKDAVRIEEMINYFPYAYAPPTGSEPFALHVEVGQAPWKKEHRLLRIGLKGKEIPFHKRPPSNLVFLLDVSGSMDQPNKLPLVKQAMKLLVQQLSENDRIAIAVYAGASGLVLPSTPGDQKEKIITALENLHAGGSTHGASGIELAYRTASEHFIKGGTNRVILATDGDFNVGVTDSGGLTRLIEEKAKTGVFLTVLGFGMGNLKDATLEKLADKGNGNYAYIDSEKEARKVFVEQIGGTLLTIAKDVKIQIDFNPEKVVAYRLIGYENRLLRTEDFHDDRKDAGEIGAGHTVTALYEIVPKGVSIDLPKVDPSKYRQPAAKGGEGSEDTLTIKLRYKKPDENRSQLFTVVAKDAGKEFREATVDFQFAAAVASFGMILRDSKYKGDTSFDKILDVTQKTLGQDTGGYRKEFTHLVEKAKSVSSWE